MEISPRLMKVIEHLNLDAWLREHDGVEGLSDGTDADGLEDMLELPFVTIDNEDSRDLDQALYIAREGDGWLVRYAIADASWFVRPGTALFAQALQRGASFSFPNFALPMLPRALSEGIVSLNEGVVRRAVVFESRVTADGTAAGTRLVRAKIRSQAKLSYNGVQAWFDAGAVGEDPWSESLRLMREVGDVRIDRSRARGVVEFDRTEARVHIGDGDRFEITVRRRNDVERWNEQLSLLCNTEGARLLSEAHTSVDDDLQSVYRVHLPPLGTRLEELRKLVGTLCVRHDLSDAWRWDGKSRLADYLNSLPEEPRRVRRAIELQVRYTNRASEYSDRVGPHFALAVDQYARFSAPMREIVGIFTHKEALESLGMSQATDPTGDRELRAKVIEAGNEAKKRQKRIDKEVMLLAIADFLADDLEVAEDSRPLRTGTVIGVRHSRVYVLLDDVPLEIKLYVEDLESSYGCRYKLRGHELDGTGDAPSFGLGDELTLCVAGFDAQRRRYSFSLR
jgi:ribonuclease R